MSSAVRMSNEVSALKREPLYKGIYHALKQRIEIGRIPPGSRAPSEADLIAEFRVSSTTARRCLNELQLAGYVERIQGKGTFVRPPAALVSCKQVGIIYNELFSLSDIFSSHILRGIGSVIAQHDVQPALVAAGLIRRSRDPANALAELVNRQEIEGLIIMSPIPLAWLARVLENGLPVVAVNFAYDDPRIASITTDKSKSVERIAHRLIENGHRHVVSVTRVFPPEISEGVRFTGLGSLAGFPKLEWRAEEFRYFAPDQTRNIVSKYLSNKRRVTAFVFVGYELALEAKEEIKLQGLRVPADISLVFLGVPAGPTDLSGEIVPVQDMGEWAAKTVLNQIADRTQLGTIEQVTASAHAGGTVAQVRET